MLMAVTGTQEEEKEFIFTTPPQHGLSYKLVNNNNIVIRKYLSECLEHLKNTIEKGNVDYLYNAEDLADRVVKKASDLWLSFDEEGIIKGCVVIGFCFYPRTKGILAEAVGGEFDFPKLIPVLEKYYKDIGYDFFEMTGRKGWERKMKPLGYDFKYITLRKNL
tara:strand:+ start:14196 stop:14684 length:489 start_codon:yes stop_codon:yes gene_type:complete